MVKKVTVPRNSVDPKLLGYISPDDDFQYQPPVPLDNHSEEKLILDLTSFTSAQRLPSPPFDPNQGDQFIFPNFGASSDNDETISSTSTNALSTTHTGDVAVMATNQTPDINPNQQTESLINNIPDITLSTDVHPPAVEINRRDWNRERLLQEKMKEKKLIPISTPAIVSRKRPLVKMTQNEKPPAFPGYEVDGNKTATTSNTNTTPAANTTPAGVSKLLGSNSPANIALVSLLTKQLKKVRKNSL